MRAKKEDGEESLLEQAQVSAKQGEKAAGVIEDGLKAGAKFATMTGAAPVAATLQGVGEAAGMAKDALNVAGAAAEMGQQLGKAVSGVTGAAAEMGQQLGKAVSDVTDAAADTVSALKKVGQKALDVSGGEGGQAPHVEAALESAGTAAEAEAPDNKEGATKGAPSPLNMTPEPG